MQPGYPGSGQDPYNQPPSDPFGNPAYGQYPQQPDPYGQQPQQQPDPYGQPQQGNPYGAPASGAPYSSPPEYSVQQPTSGQPYDPYNQQPPQYPQSAPPVQGYQQGYPPAPAYQAPVVYPGAAGYTVPGAPAATGQSNTLGLLSMIFGIVSIPLAFCCLYIGIPLGIAAVITGFLGLNKVKEGLANNKGMAMAGLICGAAGVVLGVVWVILVFALNIGSSYTV